MSEKKETEGGKWKGVRKTPGAKQLNGLAEQGQPVCRPTSTAPTCDIHKAPGVGAIVGKSKSTKRVRRHLELG